MWQDWVNVFLGIFLLIASTATKFLSGNAKFFVIGLFALLILVLGGMVSDKKWPQVVNVALSSWLLVLLFFNPSVQFLALNLFLGGFAIAVFSVGAALQQPFPEDGHEASHH